MLLQSNTSQPGLRHGIWQQSERIFSISYFQQLMLVQARTAFCALPTLTNNVAAAQ